MPARVALESNGGRRPAGGHAPPPPPAAPAGSFDRDAYYTQCRRYAVANNERFSSWRWRYGYYDDCPCIPGNSCNALCRTQCDTPQASNNGWRGNPALTVTMLAIYCACFVFLCFFLKYRYQRWLGRGERAVRREVRAAEAQCAKAEALDIELAALPLPSYSCIQPDGQSAIVTKSSECDVEMQRRETMRARVLADTRVTVRHVSDTAWVERELSEVIVHVSEEEEDEDDGEDEKNGGGGDESSNVDVDG